MTDRPPWPTALKAGLLAALTPVLVLLAVAVPLSYVASVLVFPAVIAGVAAGVVLANRFVVREGYDLRPWILAVGFLATALPALRAGAVGIAVGWLVVSTALVRLFAKRTASAADPSVSQL